MRTGTYSHSNSTNILRKKSILVLCFIPLLLLPRSAQAEELDIHGFISQGYLKTNRNNFLAETKRGTWEYAETGINFSSEVTSDLRIGIQLFTRDLGKFGNFNLELDWAFGDYTINDYLGVRIGRIKTPYGLYGETQDVDISRSTVLLPQSIYLLSLRDILISFNGVSFYGEIDLSFLGALEYQAFGGAIIGNPAQSTNSSIAQFFNSRAYQEFNIEGFTPFVMKSAHDRWSAGGALQYSPPVEGLVFKSTVLHHRAVFKSELTDAFTDQLNTLGLAPEGLSPQLNFSTNDVYFWINSIEFTLNNIIFASEYGRYTGTFRSSQPHLLPHTTLDQELYYAQLSYPINEWIQSSVYYAWIGDPTDRKGEKLAEEGGIDYHAFQHDLAFGLRFDINDFWIFKLEFHKMNGTFQIDEMDNPKHPQLEKNWHLIAAKTTLVF